MEIETLKRDNRKYWIIGSVVIILLASVVFFVATHANYKVTQKVNIANGIINYNPSDLNVMAIKVQNSSGEYDNANSVPTSGYTLSNNSYCEVNGSKDTSINIEYKNSKVIIGVNSKNTKCYLYFDKITAKDQILANKTIDTSRSGSITGVLTENTTGKVFSVEDDDGTSYMFAGAVDNNWVKFGQENGSDLYWRIIRINGDGTIRLIYNRTSTVQSGTTILINGTKYKFSHPNAYWNGSADNAYSRDNAYVGYMFTIGEVHGTSTSSYAKQIIEGWYSTYLNKSGIKEHIDTNAGFCGDRSLYSGTGIGTSVTIYGPYNRLYTSKTPSLKCSNSIDLYTANTSSKGNKALTYPVGLITADEAVLAGGFAGVNNNSYYLYTSEHYWTMSPYDFTGGAGLAEQFIVYSEGRLEAGTINGSFGLRPVINLKADTVFKSGTDGTTTNPYEVI